MTGLSVSHAVPPWLPPTGVAPRGTLLLLPGRGEHPGVYERFGRRLSADGYVVHVLDTTQEDETADVLSRAGEAAGPEPTAPVVLVGSDTGALQALRAAATAERRLPVAGVVVAGAALTGSGAPSAAGAEGTGGTGGGAQDDWSWDAELAARTACPTHRERLTHDAEFVRGGLTRPVPAHLRREALPALPALVLHGAADPVTPPARARDLAARLPHGTLGVVRDGLHDVLNDASHRTTAAVIVLWLERLRADPGLRPILTVERGEEL
ncbi:alpha/beta hydrolase [Streptomyces sp. NPDC001780]